MPAGVQHESRHRTAAEMEEGGNLCPAGSHSRGWTADENPGVKQEGWAGAQCVEYLPGKQEAVLHPVGGIHLLW